ncbi:hypothetical protein A359_03540 [secondary endosymbiont of Ctenarytaina eucalypti]|uniref:Uncharacterized protein n=2 Tax=secondary endosymbiont of Ctenarytaina eucalypti TaxID=1199245 RepID=J3Z3D6_9ENTR|nr:hypothetical protein A359_03540 [secondary endosymbiont of Ctenarytaina eucalypti]
MVRNWTKDANSVLMLSLVVSTAPRDTTNEDMHQAILAPWAHGPS